MRIHLQAESKSTDLKMIFIPLIFIFIRVWSLVVDSFDFYADRDLKYKFKNSTVGAILVLAKVNAPITAHYNNNSCHIVTQL